MLDGKHANRRLSGGERLRAAMHKQRVLPCFESFVTKNAYGAQVI